MPTATKERITAAAAGETIMDDGHPQTVAPACEDKHNGHWFCATHNEHFQNQLQKDLHTSDYASNAAHKLVWWCHKHGAETP